MSAARRCTSASASPETVYAPITSGCRRVATVICAGVVRPVQNSSTKASVVQPTAAGSMTAVNPLMTPAARSRSTRRLTAGAERDTFAPMSAYEARASAMSNATIRWSTGSMRNDSPPRARLRAVSAAEAYLALGTMTHQERMPRTRTYLMCPPRHFTVEYAINPWMDPTVGVDADLALKQWEQLRDALTDLGHTVHVLDPEPGLP